MAGASLTSQEVRQLIQVVSTPLPVLQLPATPEDQASFDAAYKQVITDQLDAIQRLGNARANPAVPALVPLLRSPEPRLRQAAADALIKIGDRSMVPTIITNLSSTDAAIRRTSADVLGGLRDPRAATALSGLLSRDTEVTVRASAARALGRIGGTAVLQPLFIALSSDTSPAVRYSAARALVDLRNSNPNAPVLQPLLNALWDPDSNVRSNIIDSLGDITNLSRNEKIRIGQMLARVVAADSDRFVRSDALALLGGTAAQTNDRGLISSIGQALRMHPDPSIKGSAAIILSTIGGPAAISSLLRCLPSRDSSVRVLAAQSLGRIGDRRAIKPLQAALARETNISVRSAMQQAIDSINRAHGRTSALPPTTPPAQPAQEEDRRPRMVA